MEQVKSFLKRWYRHLLALPVMLLLVLVFKIFNSSISDPVSDEDYRKFFAANYKVFGITLPKDLNFAGEAVPLDDFTVRESLERELMVNTYWQSQTLLFHKKCNRWFPVIEPILKRNGIPDDFKYVALIESGFSNVVSPQKATGFWQFIEPTARNYGLEITEDVDERYHVEKATEAACKYFKEAYAKYNNWTLAAASYNLGMGGVDKQLEKQQANSYYNLYLNEETSRYVFRILAVKEIISRPKAYGYQLRPRDLYPPIPTVSVSVDSSITDLAAFAIKKGSTYKILKLMNPWLLKSSLNNPTRKKYTLLFPKPGAKLYGLDDAGETSTNVVDSTQFVTKTDIKQDSLSNKAIVIYVAVANDTWETIAKKHNLDKEKLLEANKSIRTREPNAGEQVVIPVQ
jgi:membrane-bound lytic murein transglycosylase D